MNNEREFYFQRRKKSLDPIYVFDKRKDENNLSDLYVIEYCDNCKTRN